ncbi:hypothetical protein CATYP_00435 [Corynebacterium atypicum]|uniref:Uncharacterized protein n=1 Tax=Corynebacterium atypicum TaxID=191610 RepID=A0ABN4DAY4_9CORY|nr:hypothetical protein [Corynebacterium atypicum]AIG63423.1 hypothetical protein CATYP_00435 [Corynebacterium atypicum]
MTKPPAATSAEPGSQPPGAPATHPVIAVVDKQPDATVVWHVQTDPEATSFAAIMSGAWVLSAAAGDVEPGRMEDLLRGTFVVRSASYQDTGQEQFPSAAGVLPGTGAQALQLWAERLGAARAELLAAIKDAVAENPKLKAVRLPEAQVPDPEALAATYRGERQAETAWALARGAAEIVEHWHELESKRRSRAYLKARFGEQIRPVPLPGTESSAD